uniref:Uncharacterized protein n=1 Tax=Anguilla anguilla TaxID=7936 RepID=A0A0E9SWR8_ANGAN
MLSITLAS